jgi:hypothetical protein
MTAVIIVVRMQALRMMIDGQKASAFELLSV